jgi:hypothetical protein
MSEWRVYKTKKNVIVVVGTETNNEGITKIFVNDHHIPPSPAKLISTFKADSQCDYINNMLPILLDNLENDKGIIAVYKRIKKGGI